MHPMFTAQFSVSVAHVAPVVSSVLSISCQFAGSWCLVPDGDMFAMPHLTFGVDISMMLSSRIFSYLQ